MEQVFLYIVLSSMILVFIIAYFVMKIKKELQIMQQSAYMNKRYRLHIKENKLRYLALNELILIFTMFLYPSSKFIMLIIIFFFTYYNMRFFTISETRYTTKLKLKVTARVKRQITTLSIILILFSMLLISIKVPILHIFIINTYLVPLFLMIVIEINKPIEELIKNNFKKKAQTKLQSMHDLQVIGITGSYGKTSIKNIVGDIIGEFEPELRTPASFNTPNGLSITINNKLKAFHKVFLAEMGAYERGEIKELTEMTNPSIAIVSSVGPQHLDTFKSIENVQKTKMELVEHMSANGIAILNYDNEYIREYEIKRNDLTVYTYGFESIAYDMYCKSVEYKFAKMECVIVDNINNKQYVVETRLLGKHNVYNIMAGMLVAIIKNYNIDRVIKVLKTMKPTQHRLEFKKIDENTFIIDDAFNANVEGLKEAVNILSKYEGYQKIVITPGVIDLGSESYKLNNEIAQTFSGKIDNLFIVGKYNEQAYFDAINNDETIAYNKVDNFLEAYEQAMSIQNKKIILICNDLPDKFN